MRGDSPCILHGPYCSCKLTPQPRVSLQLQQGLRHFCKRRRAFREVIRSIVCGGSSYLLRGTHVFCCVGPTWSVRIREPAIDPADHGRVMTPLRQLTYSCNPDREPLLQL